MVSLYHTSRPVELCVEALSVSGVVKGAINDHVWECKGPSGNYFLSNPDDESVCVGFHLDY